MAHSITKEQEFHSYISKNVTALEAARKKVNGEINDSLRKDDDFSLKIHTKLYLLIYSSWTEALLIKVVHTPFGFSIDEKKKIFKDQDVLNKWKKCINCAFSKFRKHGSEIPNKKKKIHRLLDDYLKTQASIRNKIAHGQWEFQLHKNNVTEDQDVHLLIELVDVIQIDTWFEVFKEIVEIIRGLIDSRIKNNYLAHYNQYFLRLMNIQNLIDERKTWTIAEKKRKLKRKPRK
jgi:hypothetical protein